ncbi:MAG: arylamine N-acetyltransferase [Oscillospiraceae bacterium]|nr:arylamine N-acetyltransferase [Oscillospiraceae bacterium]
MERYLERIGYTGDRSPNRENLTRLLRCHLETVPFENLDFWQNPRQLPLQIDALYDKVVTRRRGGVCCELNTIFCWLLRELGYEAYPVLVRIFMGPAPHPLSHECVIVVLDGKKYYCDVGFGGPGPKGLVCLEEAGVQTVFGSEFTVTRDGIHFCIHGNMDGTFQPLLQLLDIPATEADFGIVLYFFTAHPDALFVNQRTINLCQPDGGYLALTGNTFTGRRGGESIRREVPEAEIPALLKQEFGLEP